MHLIKVNTLFSSRAVTPDELNIDLVEAIRDDLRDAGVPSSYEVSAGTLLLREPVGEREICVVIGLPDLVSTDFPPTSTLPVAGVEALSEGNEACLQLRGEKILVPGNQYRCSHPETSRLLTLFMFEDGVFLDIAPCTEELREEMWTSAMVAQSHESSNGAEVDLGSAESRFSVVVARNLAVNPDRTWY